MTPAARLEGAIALLDAIEAAPGRPADAVANDFFRDRRFIGSGDRRAVSDRAWRVLRSRRRLTWWVPKDTPRLLVAASLLTEGWSLAGVAESFSGGRFAPPGLERSEYNALRRIEGHTLDHPDMPDAVRFEVPDWLYPRLRARFGARLEAEMAALSEPAPLDLRVNLLKGTREDARTALAAEGWEARETPLSPWGLRIDGRRPVTAGPAFQSGLVEIQDEGSQLIAALTGARPGMRVVDWCAGAGGKTLAIAAAMGNRGQIVACDVSASRLEGAVRRLRRAGVNNVECHLAIPGDKWAKRREGAFDRVLVDAPCTGTGTWRRNPDARHRLTEQDLLELVRKQSSILAVASGLVRPGGRLIYATCSLLQEENEGQVSAFLDRHPNFMPVPLVKAWPFEGRLPGSIVGAEPSHARAIDAEAFQVGTSHGAALPEGPVDENSVHELLVDDRLIVVRFVPGESVPGHSVPGHSATERSMPEPDVSEPSSPVRSTPIRALAAEDVFFLTPARHGTDGFFAAVMERRA